MIPAEKAEVLNNPSAFTTEDLSSLPVSTHPSLSEISITEHGIFTLLSQIDPHQACGLIIFQLSVLQELTPMMTHLFKL